MSQHNRADGSDKTGHAKAQKNVQRRNVQREPMLSPLTNRKWPSCIEKYTSSTRQELICNVSAKQKQKLTDTTPRVVFERAPSTWSEVGWASRDQGTCEHTDQRASGPQIDSPVGCLYYPANRTDVRLHQRRPRIKISANADTSFHGTPTHANFCTRYH